MTSAYDEVLLGIASEHKSIESLLGTFLSFFERKTDFFDVMESKSSTRGFPEGVAERLLLNTFKRQQAIHQERSEPFPPVSAVSQSKVESSVAPFVDSTIPAIRSEVVSKPFNGGVTDRYVWSQTLSELTLEIPLGNGVSPQDLNVSLKSDGFSLSVKEEILVSGEFPHRISVPESMWNVDKATGRMFVFMEKTQNRWWSSMFVGDSEIDTSKVHSSKRLDEMDESTQASVRKIIFDQAQKAKGLPSSDEIKMQEILKKAWDAPNSPFAGSPYNENTASQNVADCNAAQ